MRVLQINSGNLYGGVEVLLHTLAQERHRAPQLQLEFALCYDGKIAQQLRAQNCPVHLLSPVRFSRPWTILSARRALKALLKRERYDVVICHHVWTQGLFGDIPTQPELLWLHDPPQSQKLHWTERLAARRTPAFVICNSEFTRSYVPRLYPNTPSKVVYCTVSPPQNTYTPADLAATRREFKADDSTAVIIQVSRWEPHKGHLNHVEALAQLTSKNWVCWFVGAAQRPHEVEHQNRVRQRAAELNIADRVLFLGWQPDVRKLIAAADIYCQPNSGPEPFGLTYIEALYAGKPVIAANAAGPAEIVTPDCGALCPPNDNAAVARTLDLWINNPALRQQLAAHGPARAHALCDPTVTLNTLAQQLRSLVPLQ